MATLYDGPVKQKTTAKKQLASSCQSGSWRRKTAECCRLPLAWNFAKGHSVTTVTGDVGSLSWPRSCLELQWVQELQHVNGASGFWSPVLHNEKAFGVFGRMMSWKCASPPSMEGYERRDEQ